MVSSCVTNTSITSIGSYVATLGFYFIFEITKTCAFFQNDYLLVYISIDSFWYSESFQNIWIFRIKEKQ